MDECTGLRPIEGRQRRRIPQTQDEARNLEEEIDDSLSVSSESTITAFQEQTSDFKQLVSSSDVTLTLVTKLFEQLQDQ